MTGKRLIVVMGVSGCGKSTVGAALAQKFDWPFLEGDTFHPQANIDKMSDGEPLQDSDRVGWIDTICASVRDMPEPVIILACSALTPLVQSLLKRSARDITFVHLATETVDMPARLNRPDHFMPATLLDSQYEALSVPLDAIEFDANMPVDRLVSEISDSLTARQFVN
jgi:gluconokinase